MSDIEYHYTESSGMELVLANNAERRYPWHIHARHWTAGMVFSGAAVLETKEGVRPLNKGEYFIVRPCEAHRLNIKLGSVFATICIDASKAPFLLPESLEAKLQIFQMAHPQTKAASPHTTAQLKILGQLLLSQAARPHNQTCSGEASVQKVLHLLTENSETPVSIPEMAAIAGYSPWYFLRCFRKETGMTPHAFQLACRLRRTRLLLRKKTAAAEAAISAGFADQSHMHKVFKQHHGLTPRQFLQASFCLEPEFRQK